MYKINRVFLIIALTILFVVVICFLLSQNNIAKIPYLYLEF